MAVGGSDGRRIVVLNDFPDIVEMTTTFLEDLGLTAHGYVDELAALTDLAQPPPPCLLVLDYRLQMITGEEFLRRARAAGATTPAVIITGATPTELDLAKLHALGCRQVLLKPFTPEELIEAVNEHCG